MVTRIHGAPRQGVWFSAGVAFISVTVDTTTYLADLTVAGTADVVNSDLEIMLEILSQRGTVIGLTVETESIAHVMVDYGQAISPLAGVSFGGQTAQDQEVLLEAEIIAATTATTCAIAVFDGFEGVANGTPA